MGTPTTAPPSGTPRPDPFRCLVREHRGALTAYAARLLGDHHLAEDIVQEALLRAWPHAERLYGSEGSIRGWLLTVVRNLVIDRMRTPSARYETTRYETARYETARYETARGRGEEAAARDHTDAVIAAVESVRLLRGLSREHREVLVHTYLCGRTLDETAGILGVPVGTVKSRRHYALRTLRQPAER